MFVSAGQSTDIRTSLLVYSFRPADDVLDLLFDFGRLIEQNDRLTLTIQTLDDVVQDDRLHSKQIIDVESEIRAVLDLMYFIENAYKRDSITLEMLQKYVRDFSEKEFLLRVQLGKIMNMQAQNR